MRTDERAHTSALWAQTFQSVSQNPLQFYTSIYIQASWAVSWFKTLPQNKLYALPVSSMRAKVLSFWLFLFIGTSNASSKKNYENHEQQYKINMQVYEK